MVCNVQEVPSCPLAHCTQFPAVLSAPSFAWHCLTMWFLICLAPDSALILSGLSVCDHKGGMKDDATLLYFCCLDRTMSPPSLPLTPVCGLTALNW